MKFITLCAIVGLLVISSVEGRKKRRGRGGRGGTRRLMRASLMYNQPPAEFVERGKEAVWKTGVKKECSVKVKEFATTFGSSHCVRECSKSNSCGDWGVCCKVGRCATQCHPLIYEFEGEEVVFNKLLDDTVDGMIGIMEEGLKRFKNTNFASFKNFKDFKAHTETFKDLTVQAIKIGQNFMAEMQDSGADEGSIRKIVTYVISQLIDEVDNRFLDGKNAALYEKAMTRMVETGASEDFIKDEAPNAAKPVVGMLKKVYESLPQDARVTLIKMGMDRARNIARTKGKQVMIDQAMAEITKSGATPLADAAVPIMIAEAKNLMKDAAKSLLNPRGLLKAGKALGRTIKNLGGEGVKAVHKGISKAAGDAGKAVGGAVKKIGNMGKNAVKHIGKLFG